MGQAALPVARRRPACNIIRPQAPVVHGAVALESAMPFAGINYLAVLVAAIAAFGFGAAWYGALGKHWMAAVGMTEHPTPKPGPFIIAFAALLVMAWALAGLIGHIGEVTVWRGVVSGFFAWLGFVATSLVVNHRFQGSPWRLTFIDGGHWFGVLVVMGFAIGLFGV
jgi:hypothetical protein